MLRSVESLRGFTIGATDGRIGEVHAFLFDSRNWTVRYLVVDTGKWLPGRKVLIAPSALGPLDWQGGVLHVNLTQEQVRNSPDIDTDKPVSRQREAELHRYYGWTPYWGTGYGIGGMPPAGYPHTLADRQTAVLEAERPETTLRSTRAVKGYRIRATDDEIGAVDDFIVDDEGGIRYLVVDTGKWLAKRKVLIPPAWVTDIRWEEQKVWVDVPRQTIKDSPPYDPAAPVNRRYEVRMYDYYGRPKYWE
ncbi:MAG: PRC-barrel domain containing protein [Planctomycetes bacterium]|nr:PRC-barrel domain containing protein [Planctomycetota bacterium]